MSGWVVKIQNTKHYPLLIKNNGAHTELISMSPELMQTHQLFKPIGQNGKSITAMFAR